MEQYMGLTIGRKSCWTNLSTSLLFQQFLYIALALPSLNPDSITFFRSKTNIIRILCLGEISMPFCCLQSMRSYRALYLRFVHEKIRFRFVLLSSRSNDAFLRLWLIGDLPFSKPYRRQPITSHCTVGVSRWQSLSPDFLGSFCNFRGKGNDCMQ